MERADRLLQRTLRSKGSLFAFMFAAATTVGGTSCWAQAYPTRPIKLVVPFIAGSPVDALARVVAQNVSGRLEQSIVIENQSGAGGTLGTKAVAGANRDGYTLLFAINSHVYGLYAKPGYDPIKSFEPIAMIAEWSHVMVVRPDFPAKTLGELIAYAKANPGKVTFGYGTNTPPQILGETLKIATGVDIRSVPYRGGAQAIQDMLGGRIDMNFGATSTLLPLIREGKLRAMAFTGAKRSPDLPDVPTVIEAGFPQIAFNPDAWAGILAPAGTPVAIVGKLNTDINEGLQSPELRASLAKLGYQGKSMSPQGFSAFLASEMKRWPPIVSAAGLKAE
jgi:tripartite-type tricarboxylate transporter receptor subunit TctC